MKEGLIGGGAGLVAGVLGVALLGMNRAPDQQPTTIPLAPTGNEWCIVHLYYGELGLERASQSWGSNNRVRSMNSLAVAAEGKFRSFEDGWLRLTATGHPTHGEVWVPEHAIRAIEWMPEETFEWRNGPPPGWKPKD